MPEQAGTPDVEPVSPEPYPLPGPVVMNQHWLDLTWLHWSADPDQVAHLLPPGVRPDTLDGRTYVGLIPFRLVDAGPGRRGRLPWLGTFLETNVRLYSVDETGRRAVVFLSLDTDRLLVVPASRLTLGIGYRWARMSHRADAGDGPSPQGEVHDYRARLRGRPGHQPASRIRIRVGARRQATPLDDFLSARWGAHTRHLGQTLHVPVAHERWPIHDATLLDLADELVDSVGLGHLVNGPPDQIAFSPGVHAKFGRPHQASTPRPHRRDG